MSARTLLPIHPSGIADALFPAGGGPEEAGRGRRYRAILEGLRRGTIDRSLFTPNANGYFTEEVLKDFASSLEPLGALQQLWETGREERGGMTFRSYRARYAGRTLIVTTREMHDGELDQFLVSGGG
jgi:D-alanyl-D-alanine carboxypeptidase